MVFKERTFNGRDPEHFDGPHPAWLEGKVAEALAAAGDLDASGIKVTCVEGVIILTGSAGSQEEAIRAVQAAATIDGVTSVDNRISVISAMA